MRAMEIAVRAAGRIVVWVQAAAEVSTAKIKSSADAGAEHVGRQRREEVVAVEFFEPRLGKGDRGDGDDHIEADKQDGRKHGGARRRACGFSVSSFTVAPVSQPQ